MRFKLDENFGARTQHLFREAGHDVSTVREQALQGATDQHLYDVCCDEERCLVTLDLDFANIFRFPPDMGFGIAVIRLPRDASLSALEGVIAQFLRALEQMAIENELWIIEVGRIRIHQRRVDVED